MNIGSVPVTSQLSTSSICDRINHPSGAEEPPSKLKYVALIAERHSGSTWMTRLLKHYFKGQGIVVEPSLCNWKVRVQPSKNTRVGLLESSAFGSCDILGRKFNEKCSHKGVMHARIACFPDLMNAGTAPRENLGRSHFEPGAAKAGELI